MLLTSSYFSYQPNRLTGRVFLIILFVMLQGSFLLSLKAAEDSSERRRKYPAKVYNITRIDGRSPIVDGKVDEECWKQGEWSGNFRVREPDEGSEPADPTEIKLLYDDDAIYVAIRSFVDDVESRDRQIARRDDFEGDAVGIAFDSYFDQRTAYEFNVTGGGSKIDLYVHPGGFDKSWNAVWDVAVGDEEDAWIAEFRIPFSQLRYAGGVKDRVWGLHSWRFIREHSEESNWQLIPRDHSGFVHEFGELRGLENLKSSRQIELMPYVSGALKSPPKEQGNPFRDGTESEFEGGIDAKIGLTSNFIVDLTINPDFGQVEADPSELNLGTFETFFREQRPFFLEGKELFEYEVEDDLLFYSRRIGRKPHLSPDTDGFKDVPHRTRILGAAKLTGKTSNGLSVGGLYAVSGEEVAEIFENGEYRDETVEPVTQFAVARIRQELDEGGTSFGAMLTGTVRDIDANTDELLETALTGGVDLSHRWMDRTHYVKLNVLGSHVEGSEESIENLQTNSVHRFDREDATHLEVDPTLTEMQGWGGTFALGKDNGGHFRYHTAFDFRSPELELNDVGYLGRADWIQQELDLSWVETKPGNLWERYSIRLHQESVYNFDGQYLNDSVSLRTEFVTNSQWRLGARVWYDSDSLDTRRLRGGPTLRKPGYKGGWLSIGSDWNKDFTFWTSISGGNGNRSNYGNFWGIHPGIRIKPNSRFSLQANMGYNKFDNDFQWMGKDTSDSERGNGYFIGRLQRETTTATLRFDLNFTPEMSLTYYGNVYLSAGTYSNYKRVTDGDADRYMDRFYQYGSDQWRRFGDDQLQMWGPEGQFEIDDPDFNYRSFKSNLVFRWEYRPGSTLFVVWSQARENSKLDRYSAIDRDLDRLIDAPSDNTLLVKASYWFSI